MAGIKHSPKIVVRFCQILDVVDKTLHLLTSESLRTPTLAGKARRQKDF
jgi:hypothetical protein